MAKFTRVDAAAIAVVCCIGFLCVGAGRYAYAAYTAQAEQAQSSDERIAFLSDAYAKLARTCVQLEQARGAAIVRTWKQVQDEIENGVVQVFAHTDHINWLQPYKPPVQGSSAGSGFFINEAGDILTNYHVVADARTVFIRIPSLGQERLPVRIVGVCPDRDVALLSLTEASRERVSAHFEVIPFLQCGDSDTISRTEEIMAVGFPLGCISVQSTLGNVSGWERHGSRSFVQLTSPLNPGNSGGPAINSDGVVVGINSAGIVGAQNIGYFIPITEIKNVLKDLYTTRLVHKPLLGLGAKLYAYSAEMREYCGNPAGGGWYVGRVYPDTPFARAGVKAGDVIYAINGHDIDMFGDVSVSWSPDAKVSVIDLLNRYGIGDTLHLVLYRNGERRAIELTLGNGFECPIAKKYPGFDPIEYEIFGGMILMPLSIPVLSQLIELEGDHAPYLVPYLLPEKQSDHGLVVTHVFHDSPVHDAHIKKVSRGLVLTSVNGFVVKTLEDFRNAVRTVASTHATHLVLDFNEGHRAVLRIADVIASERATALRYCYQQSPLIGEAEALYNA